MQVKAQISFDKTKHFYEVRDKLSPIQFMQNTGKRVNLNPSYIKIAKYVTSVKEALFPTSQGKITKAAYLQANVILCFIGLFESLMCVRTNKKLSQLFAKALLQTHEKWDEHLFYDLAYIQKDQLTEVIAQSFLKAL